jgi:hypothetical protein
MQPDSEKSKSFCKFRSKNLSLVTVVAEKQNRFALSRQPFDAREWVARYR